MTSENQLTAHLCLHLMNTGLDAVLPNWFARGWGMDVAALNRNGYFQEYEIKVSRDDFMADFRKKKKKHTLYQSLKNTKHKLHHDHEFCYVPSQFYYVCPEGLLTTKDIPKYSGLFYFMPDNTLHRVKKAPKIHAGKPDLKLTNKFYRCMTWRLLKDLTTQAGIDADDLFKIKRC